MRLRPAPIVCPDRMPQLLAHRPVLSVLPVSLAQLLPRLQPPIAAIAMREPIAPLAKHLVFFVLQDRILFQERELQLLALTVKPGNILLMQVLVHALLIVLLENTLLLLLKRQ